MYFIERKPHQVKHSPYMTSRFQYTSTLWKGTPTRQRKLSLNDILDPTYMNFIERKPPPSEKQSLHDIKVSIYKYFMERNPHQVETNCPYMLCWIPTLSRASPDSMACNLHVGLDFCDQIFIQLYTSTDIENANKFVAILDTSMF